MRAIVVSGMLMMAAISTFAQAPRKITVDSRPAMLSAGPGRKPFDVTRHLIPIDQIKPSRVPVGGIPALTDPQFVAARDAAKFLNGQSRVIGVVINGQARAYPVQILNYHELVNDHVGGRALLVSW